MLASNKIKFSLGGLLILVSLIPIGIAILANVPTLNLGLMLNIGGIGVLIGFLGFYLIAEALFSSN